MALTKVVQGVIADNAIGSDQIAANAVIAAKIPDASITLAKIVAGQGLVPSGSMLVYGGASAPTGWLLCHGQSISRSTYAALFTALSTTYGSVDGNTFNIPDLRGRVIAGQDDMGGSSANRLTTPINGDTLGAAGGVESHALSIAELAAHTHTITPMKQDAPRAGGGSGNVYDAASGTITSSSTGSGSAHTNVQPTIILNYIIKT